MFNIGDKVSPIIGNWKGKIGEIIAIDQRDKSITVNFEDGRGLYFPNELIKVKD